MKNNTGIILGLSMIVLGLLLSLISICHDDNELPKDAYSASYVMMAYENGWLDGATTQKENGPVFDLEAELRKDSILFIDKYIK